MKMTRKKFVKFLMARGYERNEANLLARNIHHTNTEGYQWIHDLISIVDKHKQERVKAIANGAKCEQHSLPRDNTKHLYTI